MVNFFFRNTVWLRFSYQALSIDDHLQMSRIKISDSLMKEGMNGDITMRRREGGREGGRGVFLEGECDATRRLQSSVLPTLPKRTAPLCAGGLEREAAMPRGRLPRMCNLNFLQNLLRTQMEWSNTIQDGNAADFSCLASHPRQPEAPLLFDEVKY